jgi:hypothetical protein
MHPAVHTPMYWDKTYQKDVVKKRQQERQAKHKTLGFL